MSTTVAVKIAATFTAEPLKAPLEHVLAVAGFPAEVEFAGYSQVFQELVRPDSALARNRDGVNVLLLRAEDWSGSEAHARSRLPAGAERESIERNVGEFLSALEQGTARCPAPFLVCLCPESVELHADADACAFLQSVEARLRTGVEQIPNGYFLSRDSVLEVYPVTRYDDPGSNRLGHIPYTSEFFAALSLAIARRIYRLRTAPPKVIVLDLDNTLWTGVVGEDGLHGIVVDDHRRFLQEFMLAQQRAGAVLCICSKNNEEDALAVFRERSDMRLQLEHFAARRINWQHKSANIRSLAAELNVGLDSMVFVDDDPAVCAEVRHACPEVTTIHLPADAVSIAPILRHLWLFDRLKVTKEDQRRTELYQQNAARELARQSATDFDDFLASLGLEISVRPMQPDQLARVSQLTIRTNQFNCTTKRRSEGELKELLQKGELECTVVHVKDRFGDYGLVGVTLHGVSGDSLVVDSFMMSCRVLGRGVEQRMVANLGTIASDRGLRWVDLRFVSSAKNRPALDFLQSIPDAVRLDEDGATIYRLSGERARALQCRSLDAADAITVPDEREAVRTKASAATVAATVTLDSLLRIATEYDSPSKLLARLESQRTVAHTGVSCDPPRTETEKALVGIWEQILRVDGIGIHDNFFDLGGHSLVSVQIVSRIRDQLGFEVPLHRFFEAPTVAEVAATIDEAGASSEDQLLRLLTEIGAIPTSSHQSR